MGQSQFTITEANKQSLAEQVEVNDHRLQIMWKGDHSRCELGHADGLCRSAKAWMINAEQCIVPVTYGRPTNRRFQVICHYEGKGQEKEDEPLWQSKGFRLGSEAARSLPIPAVIAAIREHGAEAFKYGVDKDKNTTIAEKKAEVAAWLVAFDKANADMLAKSEKRVAQILETEKEERDAAAIRAAEAAGLVVNKPSRERPARG